MTVCNHAIINEELVRIHGLQSDEYQRIISLIGREPTLTELGIFSAMWNEHCSYKSSKKWLKTLPTEGKYVIQGPGENAGVVDIGNGNCIVFKMESHNHPSCIEPYQGAATGMGGILRDIFTMGARPVAAMNALRLGMPDHPRTRHLIGGIVAGISDYGNAFGVPTVGGEVNFDRRYNGNILVNTFAAGIARTDGIFYSKAEGVGLPIVYLGARTGRDGIGGATMASAEFDNENEKKRPAVQIGDPFTEKCLFEACLELMDSGAVIAIQDMGAAGLTCSAVEMGAKGNLGVELDLNRVPVRETNMTAYEIMLSESQERMLMILQPEKEKQAETIFCKWGLDFSIIGKTTDDLRFRILHQREEVANLPIKELGDQAPEYDRPWIEPIKPALIDLIHVDKVNDLGGSLLKILNSADHSSRRWVYEQYDTIIQGNTLICPGSNAGIIRIEGDEKRALAFSSDVTPRYCQADPYEGGKQAVAECWRNITASGATPIAATDNLNFGNPEKPEIMGQLVLAIKGIGDACRALDFPIVSGNVSLYNETNGESIPPTPTIAGVGLIADWKNIATIGNIKEGDYLLLIGGDGTHLGQSIYLRDILGRSEGIPPPVDLAIEKRNGDFIREHIEYGYIHACNDISDGGLALALAEMIIKSGHGATIELSDGPSHAILFGEDQSRYIIAVDQNRVDTIIKKAKNLAISARLLGLIGGKALSVKDCFTLPVLEMLHAYESWFPDYMEQNNSG
ncbi:MAG: phosphoribosylformylglycinamidine synthase [Candidatus Tokpelaia sp. JSC189]|nr:MAG: phosphoribosylformylglycinamidine synthase [Candidatus Tokpelaia sp. JSC189]